MRFRFLKMNGCGNDFLIMDSMGSEAPVFLPAEIRFLCDRHFGIGADGMVVLSESDLAEAKWDFFNCDGSEAEMCGNAARCAIRLLADRYFPTHETIGIETKAGLIRGRIMEDGLVEVTLLSHDVKDLSYEERIIQAQNEMFQVYSVVVGVPHCVIEVERITGYPVADVGKRLAHHEAFGKDGTNVTFFQRMVGSEVMSTTFERGVERETLACGTGAAASAFVYSELYLAQFPVDVKVPGGTLSVDVSPVSRMLLLQGPAQYVFEVDIDETASGFEPVKLYGERQEEPR